MPQSSGGKISNQRAIATFRVRTVAGLPSRAKARCYRVLRCGGAVGLDGSANRRAWAPLHTASMPVSAECARSAVKAPQSFGLSVIGFIPGQFWDNAKWEQHHKALSSDPVTMPKPLLNGLFTDARQGDSDNTIGPNGFLIEECFQTAHWTWPRPFSGGQRTLPRTLLRCAQTADREAGGNSRQRLTPQADGAGLLFAWLKQSFKH